MGLNADEEAVGEVAFDGRDSVDHTERHRRGRRARRSPPRPEGQARRQDQQRTCAGEDRGAHPLVQALVRDGGVGQRVDPLRDAVDQLAPCVRDEESRGTLTLGRGKTVVLDLETLTRRAQ